MGTVKVIKQKQKSKGKGKGGQKFTTKQEKREGFFNFFSPPKVPDNEDDIDDVLQALITEDFDIGFAIKEKLVPEQCSSTQGRLLKANQRMKMRMVTRKKMKRTIDCVVP